MLEHGIASNQKFLVRIPPPIYEEDHGEWDVHFGKYDLLQVEPMHPDVVIACWYTQLFDTCPNKAVVPQTPAAGVIDGKP